MSGEDAERWVAFVRARLDEDEAVAWAAASPAFRRWHVEPWYDGNFMADGRTANGDLWGSTGIQFTGQGALETLIAEHIARHDPARALREVEAGRRILARHQPRQMGIWSLCSNCRPVDPDYPDDLASVPWPCPDFRDLAGRWSDHPDYVTLSDERDSSVESN